MYSVHIYVCRYCTIYKPSHLCLLQWLVFRLSVQTHEKIFPCCTILDWRNESLDGQIDCLKMNGQPKPSRKILNCLFCQGWFFLFLYKIPTNLIIPIPQGVMGNIIFWFTIWAFFSFSFYFWLQYCNDYNIYVYIYSWFV